MSKIVRAVLLAIVAFVMWLMHVEDRSHRKHEEWVMAVQLANEPHPDF